MTFRLRSLGRFLRVRKQMSIAVTLALCVVTAAFGAVVSYEYDELGRLRKIYYDSGMSVTYELDASGNRKTVTSAMSAGDVQFTSATFSGGEAAGLRTITIRATRTRGGNGAVAASYTITAGTATPVATTPRLTAR